MAELTSEAAMLQMLHESTTDDVTSGDDWTTIGVSLVLNATASLSSSIAAGSGGDLTTVAAETMRGLFSTTATTMATMTQAATQSTHLITTTTVATSTSSRPLVSSLSTHFADIAAKTIATRRSVTSHLTSPASTILPSSVSSININVANTATPLLEKAMNAIVKTTSLPKTLPPHQRRPAIGELLVVDEFNPWWSIRHDESVAMIIFAVVVMMVVVVVIILAHVVLRSRQGYERLSNNGDHLIVPVTPPHRYETVCRPRPEEEPDEGPRDGGFVGVTVPLVQEVTRI